MEINKDNFYDPAVKEAMKNKIKAQIEKMRPGEQKGDMEAVQKTMILNERIKLIDCCRQLDQTRITNLQKLFKHYCAHRQKPNKPMSFDEINFQYEHLTVQRFFVFIADFKLNQIPSDDGSNKQLTDRTNIILLFKKASSNARLLNFHEFIIALERLFVLLFNETQNYDKKQQKLKNEKKKRLEAMKKREAKKQEKLRKRKRLPEPEQNKKQEGEKESEEGSDESDDEQSEQEENIKQSSLKQSQKSAKKALDPSKTGQNPNTQEPKSTENDQMVKEMMKDFQLVNPTDEVKNAVKEMKKASGKEQKQEEEEDNELEIVFDPYQISDEEKIESYMIRIHADNFAKMQKKMRRFQKANHKFHEVDQMSKAMEVKKSKMKFLKKDELTHYENGQGHEQWSQQKRASQQFIAKRMKNIKEILQQRDSEKNKSYLGDSIAKDIYEYKKNKNRQGVQKKQKEHMFPHALARLTKMSEIQFQRKMQYSLDMINRSTPNQLAIGKINPQRYGGYDPSDRIYLQEFDYDTDRPLKGIRSRGDVSVVESTKRRAKEIEIKQATRLNRMAEHKLKNPHYLQKFLERKW